MATKITTFLHALLGESATKASYTSWWTVVLTVLLGAAGPDVANRELGWNTTMLNWGGMELLRMDRLNSGVATGDAPLPC